MVKEQWGYLCGKRIRIKDWKTLKLENFGLYT